MSNRIYESHRNINTVKKSLLDLDSTDCANIQFNTGWQTKYILNIDAKNLKGNFYDGKQINDYTANIIKRRAKKNNLIFTGVSCNKISKTYKRATAKTDILINSIEIKKTYAYVMINREVPIKTISKNLGHRTIKQTIQFIPEQPKKLCKNIRKIWV